MHKIIHFTFHTLFNFHYSLKSNASQLQTTTRYYNYLHYNIEIISPCRRSQEFKIITFSNYIIQQGTINYPRHTIYNIEIISSLTVIAQEFKLLFCCTLILINFTILNNFKTSFSKQFRKFFIKSPPHN